MVCEDSLTCVCDEFSWHSAEIYQELSRVMSRENMNSLLIDVAPLYRNPRQRVAVPQLVLEAGDPSSPERMHPLSAD